MRPVEQTIARPPKGDCFRACIASILELPIEETPNPPSDPDGHWWNEWIEWLETRGYELIQWTVPQDGSEQQVCGALRGYWIATVPSLNAPPPPPDRPNLGRHAIVMHGDQIAHDPSTGEKWSMKNWDSAGGRIFEVTLVHPLDPTQPTKETYTRERLLSDEVVERLARERATGDDEELWLCPDMGEEGRAAYRDDARRHLEEVADTLEAIDKGKGER